MTGCGGVIEPEGVKTVESGETLTAEAAATAPEELLAGFRIAASRQDADWQSALLETMALWPLAEEVVGDRTYVYLIAGEAFDWRTLAERILCSPEIPVPEEEREELLMDPALPSGIDEEEFRNRLGFAKSSAFLNYFYGVTVEQAILLAVEEEIRKRRYSRGFAPNDDRSDAAYEILYRSSRNELVAEFKAETGIQVGPRPRGDDRNRGNMGDMDQFTYWLFRLRFKDADPARIASDTRKGLEQLERMRLAHARRTAETRDGHPFIDMQTLHRYKSVRRGRPRLRVTRF